MLSHPVILLKANFGRFANQQEKHKMAQHYEDNPIRGAVELLKTNGFDALAEAVTVLLNTAMVAERSAYLGAAPYERSVDLIGYANGYKDKQLITRLGTLPLKVPQTRHGDFYPQSLEKGLRSERSLLLAIAEMYVQGVWTRRVKRIVEELCGLEVRSSQVSRAAAEVDEMLEAGRTRKLGIYSYIVLDAQYEKVRQAGQVSDAHEGLQAARKAVFPSVRWQRSPRALRCSVFPPVIADGYAPPIWWNG
jgi:transposase-like protein